MKIRVLACMGVTFASAAFATPPPAPTITVAATDIKQLQFDITPVPRANWYELWFRANPGAQWVQFARTVAQKPMIRTNVAVHLLDWRAARYYVKACNPGGCSRSNEVGVDGEQFAAMGYFKPQTPGPNQYYGHAFAVSADGQTLAVLGIETVGTVPQVGTIHVYRKTTSTSGWRHEARIVPSVVQSVGPSGDGDPLAISPDGKLIVLGNFREGPEAAGAVYVFRRGFSGWAETQRITGENTPNDNFGFEVKLNRAMDTLVIEHQRPGGVSKQGTLEVYRDPYDSRDQFFLAATIPPPIFGDSVNNFCRGIAISDAFHIVRLCHNFPQPNFAQILYPTEWSPLQYDEQARVEESVGDGVAIDSLGKTLLIQDHSYAAAFRREANGWVSDGYLHFLDALPDTRPHMALSADGKIVAIGSRNDNIVGRGPIYPPYSTGDRATGTVAVFERRTSGWSLRRVLKPDSDNQQEFGYNVALDYYGRVLAVGAPSDRSKATGIDGNRNDHSVPVRGAVWLY